MQQPEIFISYAWESESEKIVDILYNTFVSKGYEIVRDKVNLRYKGSITSFMDRIGQGKYVIVVISDKYIKSENCMYEIVQIAKNGQFHDRIFPIVLSDANFYKPVNRIKYIAHWENQKKELNESMKTLDDMSIIAEIQKELENYNNIHQNISNILFVLKDMNTLTPDIHQDTHFEALFKHIDDKIALDKKIENPISTQPIVSHSLKGEYTVHSPLSELKDYTFQINGVDFEMVFVEGGTYQMGYNAKRDGKDDKAMDCSKPLHQVTVDSFFIGKYPVTQAQWQVIMGNNPSDFKGEKLPVECVSWEDCKEFINKLNRKTGKKYRLPTEEEWEYAARGGKESDGYKYAGSNNIDLVAWYEGNSDKRTHNVGEKQPNELGIYDMSGNVWEWINSGWSENYEKNRWLDIYILRGGSWDYFVNDCRVANRKLDTPTSRYYRYGFRLLVSQ
jgi:formylglycine-generating enzyme required for sulfatase activity